MNILKASVVVYISRYVIKLSYGAHKAYKIFSWFFGTYHHRRTIGSSLYIPLMGFHEQRLASIIGMGMKVV